jgi:hypothetical protein
MLGSGKHEGSNVPGQNHPEITALPNWQTLKKPASVANPLQINCDIFFKYNQTPCAY